jgi:peptide/nickel transport system substrate-binding protein
VIRDDATWSDGTPITADDFRFMWEAQSDPEGDAAPAGTQGYEEIESIEDADDGKTVTITYSRPYADWDALFDYIYPRHYFEEEGDGDPLAAFGGGFPLESLPSLPMVSGGPFQLTEYSPGSSMILERNDEYWAEPAGPDRIIGVFLTDAAQYPQAIENDEFDVGYPQAQLDLVQQLEQLQAVSTEIGFGTFWEHIDFNLENEQLAVPEVRQAIALAVDREDIVETITRQFSDEAQVLNNRIYFPDQDDYVDNSGEYGQADPDRARQMLEELGCDDGDISVRLVWRDPNPRRQQTAEIIQDQLSQVGIDVRLDPQDDFLFLEEGNFDIALFGWTGGTSLGANTSLYATGQGQNLANYSNEQVDELLADAEVELDEAERADLYNEVDEILWEDLPTIPLFQNPDVLTWQDAAVAGPSYNGFGGPTWNMAGWTTG